MSSFRDRFGRLTVGQVKELNEAAKWYCDHEVTAEGEEECLKMKKTTKDFLKGVKK